MQLVCITSPDTDVPNKREPSKLRIIILRLEERKEYYVLLGNSFFLINCNVMCLKFTQQTK